MDDEVLMWGVDHLQGWNGFIRPYETVKVMERNRGMPFTKAERKAIHEAIEAEWVPEPLL